MREYLATGLQVISTNIPEVRILKYRLIGENHEQFIEHIEKAVNNPVKKEIISDSIREESREAKVDELRDFMEKRRRGDTGRMSRNYKFVILFLILFIGWIFLAPLLAENLIVEKNLDKADAILVLSGSSVYKERIQKAAEVYKNDVAKIILLTDDGGYAGWSQIEERNLKFVEMVEKELISQGVAAEDIEILDPQVTGTIFEAKALKDKIKKENWKSVLIVTSAYHTKRSLWTIEDVIGKNVRIGIVFPANADQTLNPFTWWLSVRGWKTVGGEYLKSVYYWVYY